MKMSTDEGFPNHEFPDDHSVLQQPLNLGVRNVKQILKCIQSGSREVKDIILNECNIIYECKVCLSLFRSLANFLYHKRCFCKTHLCEKMLLFDNMVTCRKESEILSQHVEEEENVSQSIGDVCLDNLPQKESISPNKNSRNGTENTHNNEIEGCGKNFGSFDSSIDANNSGFGLDIKNSDHELQPEINDFLANSYEKPAVVLKPIINTSNAMHQTLLKLHPKKKAKKSDIGKSDEPLSIGTENSCKPEEPGCFALGNKISECIVLSGKGKDGNLTRKESLLNRSDCSVQSLTCLNCSTVFTTLKTLYFHMMSLHSHKRMYYPCPFCKALFVQMYGVTRHLLQIHGKTKDQINNKMREAIRKKAVWRHVDNSDIPNDEKIVDKINLERSIQETTCDEKNLIRSTSPAPKMFHSYLKVKQNTSLHHCSKCNRVFGRKSSQVSHEKFCIMNVVCGDNDTSDHGNSRDSGSVTKNIAITPITNTRPKRGAEKRMHKDFVNSQTLKWRSANKIDTGSNADIKTSMKRSAKTHERKMMAIMNSEKLLCLKCDRSFSSFSNLRRHAAIHIGFTRFKCKQCDFQSYNKSDCRHHVLRMHSVIEEDSDMYIIHLQPDKKESVQVNRKQTKPFHVVNRKKIMSNRRQVAIRKTVIPKKKNILSKQHVKAGNPPGTLNIKKRGEKIMSSSLSQLHSSPPNYKSLSTDSPTTIILSKTCSSATVHITKSSTSASWPNPGSSKENMVSRLSPPKTGHNGKICGTRKSLCPSKSTPLKFSCKNEKNCEIPDNTFVKCNSSINEWYLKRPFMNAVSKRRKEPLIIGLVPASPSFSRKGPPTDT